MQKTDIEWADFSSNPIKLRLRESGKLVNACVKCSPGCENCYAEAMTRRWWPKTEGKFPGYSLPLLKMGDIVANDDELRKLLRAKPRGPFKNGERPMVFVGDMNDSGGDWVPHELLDKLFAVAALRPDMIFQILTKRPERMAEYLDRVNMVQRLGVEMRALVGRSDLSVDCPGKVEQAMDRYDDCEGVLPNVWLGTSVENQEWADKRIPHLLRCPASVRFLSIEPLIGPVDVGFEREVITDLMDASGTRDSRFMGSYPLPSCPADARTRRKHWIDWIIVGGESGPGARPMHPDWVRSLRDQCQAAGVAFFFKQWGEFAPVPQNDAQPGPPSVPLINLKRSVVLRVDGDRSIYMPHSSRPDAQWMIPVGKKHSGRLLDSREWNEFPKVASERQVSA